MNDLLGEAAQTIVLPMSAAGLQTLTYNANLTNASIVEMGKQLLAASRDGLADEVATLLARSAPMTTDWLGTSPLHLAAINGHCATAEVLMRSGCSRDARTKVDKTPLHQAATEGHANMVELLIKSGAEVDSKDMLRMTPLHWAVERGHADSAEILVRYGADVNFENKFGKCPLELASEHGRSDIYEMLQNAEEIRATRPVNIVPHDPLTSDPVTMAATQSIAHELGSPPTIGIEDTHDPQDEGISGSDDAMKLLEAHGITLLPEDSGGGANLMDTAMNSGRSTLTLTEAGKLALSSSTPTSPVITTAGADVPPSFPPIVVSAAGSGVNKKIVTATMTAAAPSTTSIRAIKPAHTVTQNVNTSGMGVVGQAKFLSASVSKPTAQPIQTTKSIVINTSHHQQQQQQAEPVRKATRVIRVTPEQFAAIKAGKSTPRLTGIGTAASPALGGASTVTPSNVITLNKGGGGHITKAVKVDPGATIKAMTAGAAGSLAGNAGGGQKTIKIVRINPSGGVVHSSTQGNVQIMPKPPAILTMSAAAASGATSVSSAKLSTPATVVSAAPTLKFERNSMIQKQLKEIKDAREALARKEEELMRQLGP